MRIDTQKQTLTARDESIKKLLEMLQNKGEGKFDRFLQYPILGDRFICTNRLLVEQLFFSWCKVFQVEKQILVKQVKTAHHQPKVSKMKF